MKSLLPLVKSTARGGLKVAAGILIAAGVIGLGVWGYSAHEEGEEDRLAKARLWDAKDVAPLRSTIKLRTKYDGSHALYILTLETRRRPDVAAITLDLVDAGGFKLAGEVIPVSSLVESGEGDGFSAEGAMDAYISAKDYENAAGWNIGWRAAR